MTTPEERRPTERSDRTDRARLEQIQQQQLTESRLNEDFLNWLKNKGPNYLFVLLLGLCGVMGWNWWQRQKAETRTNAWIDLGSATLPAAYEEVASNYRKVDAVAPLALLGAADRYMNSVLSGARFDRQPTDADHALTPELREQWLAEADRLYGQVLASARTAGERERAGFIIAAHFGRAAVAESRGDLDAARRELESVAAAAGKDWAPLAAIARERIADLDSVAVVLSFPSRAELPQAAGAPTPFQSPLFDDALIRELLTPSSDSGGS